MEEINTKVKKILTLIESNDMLHEIFTFLPGYHIIHKTALLNKRMRQILIDKKNLATGRLITLKVNDSIDFKQKENDESHEDQDNPRQKLL